MQVNRTDGNGNFVCFIVYVARTCYAVATKLLQCIQPFASKNLFLER